jgi:hypothetical protein
MRDVAKVLGDVPAVPERVVDLAVQVTPERGGQGLPDRRARRHRPGEHGLGIGHAQGQHDRGAADRGRCQHPHLGELVRNVQLGVPDPQLDRHQPSIGDGDPAEFLGAEGVAVERDGALGALDNDVCSDRHGSERRNVRGRRD